MNKIKAVIFDLDGTIGDTLPLCIKAFRHSLESLTEKTVTDFEIFATFGVSEEGTIMALAPDRYEKGIADYLHYYEAFHDICPAPFEGMIELLDTLKNKNIRLAMVTGKGKHSTEITLKKFDLENYFEIIDTGVSTGPRKPEGLQNIINEFSELSKEEMIYIGDTPSDIESCQQVGMPVVAAGWAENVERERLIAHKPNEIFYSVLDLTKWLFTMI